MRLILPISYSECKISVNFWLNEDKVSLFTFCPFTHYDTK